MRKYVLLLLSLLLFQFSLTFPLYADNPIKVGVYQNEPLVFIDSGGNVQGIYIDILEYVASREGWRIEYVPGSWPQCLERLEKGEIDLLVGIAYSEERDERYDFTNETLLSNWGQVYTRKNAGIQSILDLEGRTVAVLKGDIYYAEFGHIIERFNIDCDFVKVDEYATIFQLVDEGETDAGLITRLYGLQHERDYSVDRSPIICCPIELRFAAPEGKNQHLLNAIDRHLAALKGDQESIYYQSLNRWFGGISGPAFPEWLKWVLASAGGLLLLFLGGNIVLRAQVRARTRELQEEITERKRAEEEQERHSRELAMLNEIGRAVTSSLDLKEVLTLLLNRARRGLGAEACSVALLDDSGDLVFHHAEGEAAEAVVGLRLKPGQGIAGWVAQSGQAALVPDAHADPRFYGEVVPGFTTCDIVCVPLVVHGEVIGVIELLNKRQGTFAEDDVRVLESVATQAATAIENARLHEETHRRLAREERLNELAHTLGGEMELATLIPRLLPPVAELTGADASTVAILDPDREVITYLYNYNLPDALAGVEVPAGGGLAGHTIQARQPVLLDDYRGHPGALPTWVAAGVRSMLSVPLLVGDEVMGGLGLFTLGEVRPFGPEAVAAAEAAGRLAAVAIQRARLFQDERKKRQLSDTLRQLATTMSSTLDLQAVLDLILEQLERVVTYDSASIQLVEDDQLKVTAARGFADLEKVLQATYDVETDFLVHPLLYEGRSLVLDNVREDERWQWQEGMGPIRSWLGVPLLVRDRAIGVLTVDSERVGFYTQEDARTVAAFAAQAATAIENARLYAEAQRRLQEQIALREAGAAISSTLDRQAVLNRIAEQMGQAIDATSAYIAGFEAETMTSITLAEYISPHACALEQVSDLGVTYEEDLGFIEKMLARQHDLAHVDDPQLSESERAIMQQYGAQTILYIPLWIREQLIGFAELWESRRRREFTPEEIALCQSIAQQAAIAIENARLYEQAQQEIAERKRAEERLRLLSSAVEQSTEGIAMFDLKGNLLFVNDAFATMHGYTPEELAGKHLSIFHTPEQMPAVEAANWQIQKTGEFSGEIWHARRDGTVFPTLMHNSLLRDETGNPIGMIATLRDITERKRLETQLRQAQKMEAIGHLAGGIAHDFNNLLTPIGGFAELLLRKAPEGSQQQEDLRQIKIAAKRAAALTRQLRLFTRQEEGERRPLQLNSIVEETRDLLERSIPKEITIELCLEPESWAVEADPSQISQVLMNLCLNARDAMPDGGTLTMETRNVTLDEEQARAILAARPGRYVRLSVSDIGCGMSPEVQDRLFEPFFTTKEPGEGTGLGLAVAYGIVKGHSGFINVYSEEGQGSTFRVYLPAIELAVEEREVEVLELPTGTETILLVDDEETVQKLGQRTLERCGYTVLKAENGVQALEVYQAHQGEIALVVLDVVMPQMSGRECLRRLREMDPQVKVLISTGYTANSSAQKLVAEGALGVVEKPFLLRDFATAVRTALDKP